MSTPEELHASQIETLRAFSRLVNGHALALENSAADERTGIATRLALQRSAILARRLARSSSDDAADLEELGMVQPERAALGPDLTPLPIALGEETVIR